MGRKKYFAALAAAGMIGAMALGTAVTSYAADGWTKTNDHWTYINQGKTHTGWLQTSEGYYYMDLSTGYMTTGFKQIDGKWYFFDGAGYMVSQCYVRSKSSDLYHWIGTDGVWDKNGDTKQPNRAQYEVY